MFEHVADLRRRDAGERKWRQRIFQEELSVTSFVARLRRTATNLADEEELVGMEHVGRVAVEIAIENSSEFADANFVPRFFACFTSSGGAGSFADVRPTAGESPQAILKFANEEDPILPESRDANIDLGSGIAGLLSEEIENRSNIRNSSSRGGDLSGDFSDFAVALDVELVLAIGEAGLRNGLKTTRPGKPLRIGHGVILAQELATRSIGFSLCTLSSSQARTG